MRLDATNVFLTIDQWDFKGGLTVDLQGFTGETNVVVEIDHRNGVTIKDQLTDQVYFHMPMSGEFAVTPSSEHELRVTAQP